MCDFLPQIARTHQVAFFNRSVIDNARYLLSGNKTAVQMTRIGLHTLSELAVISFENFQNCMYCVSFERIKIVFDHLTIEINHQLGLTVKYVLFDSDQTEFSFFSNFLLLQEIKRHALNCTQEKREMHANHKHDEKRNNARR